MIYKLIALDIDNTIVNYENPIITNRCLRVLENAISNDIYVVPCSGRPFSRLPKELMDLDVKYAIVSNGARIYDIRNNNLIYKAELDKGTAYKIIEFLQANNLLYVAFINDKKYSTKDVTNRIVCLPKHSTMDVQMNYVDNLCDFIKNSNTDVQKITIIFKNINEKNKCEQFLRSSFKQIKITSSAYDNIEINNINADKGIGLAILCEHLNISLNETIAIGDNENDVSALSLAKLAIVPSNASNAAKEHADIITKPLEMNGVADAINEIITKGETHG